MSNSQNTYTSLEKSPVISVKAKVEPLTVNAIVSTSVATDHSRLSGRDTENSHPIGAISDLAFRLDDKLEETDIPTISNLEIDDLLK